MIAFEKFISLRGAHMQWLKKIIGFTTPEEDELNLMREETRRLEKEKNKLEQSVESLKKELEVKESKMVIVDESILLQETYSDCLCNLQSSLLTVRKNVCTD